MPLTDEQKNVCMAITVKLAQLGHELSWVDPVTVGPIITTYRFFPKNAAKVSQITSLHEDIALALHVEDVTIRRIPGEGCIGISVPNRQRSVPHWRDNLQPDASVNRACVPLLLGVDSQGKRIVEDLAALPHLLIAGSTGGGKSVLERALIASICYWRDPTQVQVCISDTKLVEFGLFANDPHLWRPHVTTTMDTLRVMDDLINEMELRLQTIAQRSCQNITQFNERCYTRQRMPYLVLFIDELADFMGKSADKGISKLAEEKLGLIVQRARATGVYVIAATQRPSVDVVTGTIKSNFPARLSFRLPTEADSRTILGHSGAEQLLSLGDCYYSAPTQPGLRRLHSCYATNDDIQQCISFARLQQAIGDKHESKRFDSTVN